MTQKVVDLGRIANALAIAALGQGSTSVIDKMAFAMNSEQAINALNEALRTIASLQNSGAVSKVVEKVEEREVTKTVVIGPDNKRFEIFGALPDTDEVSEFIDEVTKDPRVAKKIGAIALDLYVKAYERVK